MLEYTEKALVISCTACGAVCMVGSDHACSSEDGGLTTKPVKGRAYIVVRNGRTDERFWREVDAGPEPRDEPKEIKLPGGEIVTITEYPFFCDDCYETGGDKLDASWKRTRRGICDTCGKPAVWRDKRTTCGHCRSTPPRRV